MQLYAVAHRVAADHVEQLLQGRPFGVQQQLVVAVEHAQVTEHLALLREERRVGAGARGERADLLRDLAVEKFLGIGTAERELAALGAIQ